MFSFALYTNFLPILLHFLTHTNLLAVDFDTRLRRVGVNSSLHVEPALPHGFIGLIHTSKSAARAISKATAFIEEVFETGGKVEVVAK
jgi:hypothetical protein